MKIVHVIPALTKGGAERVVVDLSNHAAEAGHSVTIVTAIRSPSHLLADQLNPNVELKCVDPKSSSVRSTYPKLVPWLLANRKWLLDSDVIHCHLSFGSVFAAILQRLRGARPAPAIVDTYHGVGVAMPSLHKAIHSGFLFAGRDAVAFMAQDSYWSRYTEARKGRRFPLIPNGIAEPRSASQEDVERFRVEQTGLPKARGPVIGSVGRLVPERRPDLLLKTFHEIVKRTDADVHLLLAGEGAERPALEQEIRNLGMQDRIHLSGLILNPAEAFSIIDLYLTVNVGPITGIAGLEAAFSGLPIIAVQLVEDYVPGPDDWIWSSGSPSKVAEKAAALIADPSKLKALARKQRAHARSHYSVEAMANAYYRLYREVLAARAAGVVEASQASRGV